MNKIHTDNLEKSIESDLDRLLRIGFDAFRGHNSNFYISTGLFSFLCHLDEYQSFRPLMDNYCELADYRRVEPDKSMLLSDLIKY
jgi:hypothetical protein